MDQPSVGAEVTMPSHDQREVAWRQKFRGGTIDDRTLRSVRASIPPDIANVSPTFPNELLAESEEAVRAMAHLDATRGEHLAPLATLLLRAESVASSKIEHEEATVEDFARALHGIKANSSATAMVAASGAMDTLMGGGVALEEITAAHRRLMADDTRERPHAGRWRDMQNWIGGSNHSPRNALYVPPPPTVVQPKMVDLMQFANRTNLPVVGQAAIAHAQFESIHPFTDGNGRIGRALAAAVIRQRGVTRKIVVPIASALAARRELYFDALNEYRGGDAGPITRAFARSALVAAREAATTADRVAAMPDNWRSAAGRPRSGSAPALLLDSLLETPIFTADDITPRLRAPAASVYRSIDRLASCGVVRPLTQRTRNQIWGAGELLDELEDLGIRIAAEARETL